jgi:hypothetical protein
MPPFVTVSAAATFTKTPAPQGVTFVYCEGTSNVAPARVVVIAERPRPRLVVGIVTRVGVTVARIVIIIVIVVVRLVTKVSMCRHPSIHSRTKNEPSSMFVPRTRMGFQNGFTSPY